VLLQLLDEGRLTDSQGHIVDFKNAIIIMTSNLGSTLIQQTEKIEDIRDQIMDLMKATFKPEFLNRVDEIITFNRLGKEEILKIVDIQLGLLSKRLEEQDVTIKVSDKAKAHVAQVGFDPQYGARPLKRTLQNLIQNPLAKNIIAGEVHAGDTVVVDAGKEGLQFRKQKQ
jgi:ATP-dependent Clp protease ATP-binding subunit ClpB